MSLPAADDLFRRHDPDADPDAPDGVDARAVRAVPDTASPESSDPAAASKRASGRVKHDEKMTVYVTAQELIDLEQARLTLRGRHGLAVDRGRLVREALAVVLHDLDENAEASMLVHRLNRPESAG